MGDRLEQALAEADEIEAIEAQGNLDVTTTATGTGQVTVTRPNRARSKVLQVRLNPDEYEALERLAEARGVPVSTIARAQLLDLLAEPTDDPLERLKIAARTFANALP